MTQKTEFKELENFLKLGVRELVDSLPAAMFIKDRNSHFVLVNRACEENWGLTHDQLFGTDASAFFPPEQMASFLAQDRAVFASKTQIDVRETFWSERFKANRMGHTFKRPMYDAQGDPQFLVCVIIDITEQARAESEARELNDKLRGLFDFAPMGIALTDMQGRFMELNRAFEAICGYSQEELKALGLLETHPPALCAGGSTTTGKPENPRIFRPV